MTLERVLIVDPEDGEYTGRIVIETGKIVDTEPVSGKAEVIAMPGFIDSHTHGAAGMDFMDENLDWRRIADFFASQGVTTFFPTSVSAPLDAMLDFLSSVDGAMSEIPSVRGAHLEGPYISKEKKGAQNAEYIRVPKEFEIDEILRHESFKLITLAPEVVDSSIVGRLARAGKVVSLGHSNATYEEAKSGIEAGASRITHFPNALRAIHHREVGIAGAALLSDVYTELIVDLVHVSPQMIEIVVRMKGYDRIVLITDSISATGLEDGEYQLGGLEVIVKNGIARLKDGTLAGSTLKFMDAVKNFKRVTGCSLVELAKVSSYNVAKNLGFEDLGRISSGYRADIVLLDFDLNLLEVYKDGVKVKG